MVKNYFAVVVISLVYSLKKRLCRELAEFTVLFTKKYGLNYFLAFLYLVSGVVLFAGPARASSIDTVAETSATPDMFGTVLVALGKGPKAKEWASVRQAPLSLNGDWARFAGEAQLLSPLERVQAVNSWVNRQISYTKDSYNYGALDHWAPANVTLASRRGDCEDFAIVKMQLLKQLGFDEADIFLVLGRELVSGADHAVLIVRANGKWVGLDNFTNTLLDTNDTSYFRPVITYSSTKSWINGKKTRFAAK